MKISEVVCFIVKNCLLVVDFLFGKFSSDFQMLVKFLMFILVYPRSIIRRANLVIMNITINNIIKSKDILFDCIVFYLFKITLVSLYISGLTFIFKGNVSKYLSLDILLAKLHFNRFSLFLSFLF